MQKQVDLSIEGSRQVPSTGGVILCCNHEHHLLDGAILMSQSRRPTHIVVARDWLVNGISGVIMPRMNRAARWPMVDRTNSPIAVGANRIAVGEITALLAEGRVVVIFPEGYPAVDPNGARKRSGELLPFQRGLDIVLREAKRATGQDIPVVPVGLQYATSTGKPWTVVLRYGTMRAGRGVSAPSLREDIARLIS